MNKRSFINLIKNQENRIISIIKTVLSERKRCVFVIYSFNGRIDLLIVSKEDFYSKSFIYDFILWSDIDIDHPINSDVEKEYIAKIEFLKIIVSIENELSRLDDGDEVLYASQISGSCKKQGQYTMYLETTEHGLIVPIGVEDGLISEFDEDPF